MAVNDRYHDGESEQLAFSIFIPSYNRAHTLGRALASIQQQTFKDYEVLVIDDGSTDNTPKLVEAWQSKGFPIRYYCQENQGKFAAHNHALNYARGELFVLLDSDDLLVADALERIKHHWDHIPEERRGAFAGVEGLAEDLDGCLSGNRFPKDVWESNYLESRYLLGVGGEKKGAIRTDILKQYPYPVFPGEKHIRDSILWERISEHYQFLYVNEVFQRFEYQADGLTANIFKVRMKNPQGFRFYYLEDISRPAKYFSRAYRLDSYHRYIRFSLHCGIGLLAQLRAAPDRWQWLRMLPKGVVKWLSDRLRMKRLGINNICD